MRSCGVTILFVSLINFSNMRRYHSAIFYIILLLFFGQHYLSGQTIEFDEIAPIPHSEIRFAFVSPSEDLYVVTLSFELIISKDKGKTWTVLPESIYNKTEFLDIQFLESGDPIIVYRWKENFADSWEYRLARLQDNSLINILPTQLSSFRYYYKELSILGDDIYLYDGGRFLKSVDKGDSYTELDFQGDELEHYAFIVTDSNILISHVDVINGLETSVLAVYELNGQFIKEVDLEFGEEPSSRPVDVHADGMNWVFFDNETGLLHYTTDLGVSFLTIDLGNGQLLGQIDDDRFYFRCDQGLCGLTLDDSFETNQIETLVEDDGIGVPRAVNHYFAIDKQGFADLRVINLRTGNDFEIDRATFPSSLVTKFHVRSNGGIVAGVRNSYFFESNDEGLSWTFIKDYLNQLGGEMAYTDESIIAPTHNGVVETFQDGTEETWTLDFFSEITEDSYHANQFNNGEFRLVMSSCGTGVYLSTDFGPFEFVEADSPFCFERFSNFIDMESKIVEDQLFIFNKMTGDETTLMILDLNSKTIQINEHIDEVNFSFVGRFSLDVSDSGELFLNPYILNGSPFPDTIPIGSFYAPDPFTEFSFAGVGTFGSIHYNEEMDATFITSRDSDIFFRPSLGERFDKLDIIDRDFNRLRAMTFDNEGRLLIQADHKRIFRSDLSGLTSLIEEIEKPIANLTVYPNPSFDRLNLGVDETSEALIFDHTGQKVMGVYVDENSPIDISHLNAGIYFVQVISGQGSQSELVKFLKM